MNNDNLKIARDRITTAGKDETNKRQISAIEKARRREINKQIFRTGK